MNKIDLRNLDKSNWKSFPFEKIAQKISETVDPGSTNLKIYVGLEHIDPDDIHIRRFGTPDDVSGGKLKCYPGDVIFGKRRAYQRKAAVVDFEGICSAHAFVLRPNEKIIDHRLFPFFLHSDQFMHRMVDISVGGLSPTINWGDLKHQEFLLPPKEVQSQLAGLLSAMDEVIERERELFIKLEMAFDTVKDSMVLKNCHSISEFSSVLQGEETKSWIIATIGDLMQGGFITNIQDGNHGELHPKSSDYVDDGIPFIMANNIFAGQLDLGLSKRLPQHITDKLRIGFSYSGDVLLSHKGTIGQVAIVPDNLEYPYVMLTPQVTYYRTNSQKLLNEFLYFVFRSSYFQKKLESMSSQSTRAYIGITAQRNIMVAFPESIIDQAAIVNRIKKFQSGISGLNSKIESTKALRTALIKQIFDHDPA